MESNQGHKHPRSHGGKDKTQPAATLAPPVAPPEILPLDERMEGQKQLLLKMQSQLQTQLNGVSNQLFLITQLENPGKVMDPATGEPVEPPEAPLNDTPPGTM